MIFNKLKRTNEDRASVDQTIPVSWSDRTNLSIRQVTYV